MTEYVKHLVSREDRDDGAILLHSDVPLGAVARNSGTWLHRWAAEAPDRVFIAERSGAGWREAQYGAVLAMVRAVAAALLARGLGPGKSIVVLSGPSVDHAILTLAAQYIGAPIVPLAEQYSLIPEAHPRLIYTVTKSRPSMIYASSSEIFGAALALPELAGPEMVVSSGAGNGYTDFADLLAGQPGTLLIRPLPPSGRTRLPRYCSHPDRRRSPKGCRRHRV